MGDPAGDSGGSRGQAWVSGAPRSGPRPGSGPSAAHVRSRVEAEAQSRGPRGREFAVPGPLGPALAPWLLVPGHLRVNSDSPGAFGASCAAVRGGGLQPGCPLRLALGTCV